MVQVFLWGDFGWDWILWVAGVGIVKIWLNFSGIVQFPL
jgi:hypothetical protein